MWGPSVRWRAGHSRAAARTRHRLPHRAVRRALSRRRVRRPLGRAPDAPGHLVLSFAAPLLLGAHLVAWALNAAPDHRVDAAWIGSALGTNVGRVELWRALLALPALWALALARRPGLALILSVLPILVSAAVGHSYAFDPTMAVPAKALHLFALAAWIGGLLWLIVRERNDAARFSREARRVSTVALWAVVVLTASGIVQTLILIPSIGALRSNYGFVILAKVAGLIALIGFGAYHRFRVVPKLSHSNSAGTTSFLSSLRAELAVLWLVILLGGLLGYVSPPDGRQGITPLHRNPHHDRSIASKHDALARSRARIAGVTSALTLAVYALGLAHAVVYPKASTTGAYERYVIRVPNERKVPTTRVEITSRAA